MRLIVDAMGGDNAPEAIVRGAALACRKRGVDLTLVGDESRIREYLPSGFECRVVHTKKTVSMDDDPLSILRENRESSMGVGLSLLKEDGDAFLSAGSTGALVAGASSRVIFGKIRGIKRAAIATVLPLSNPVLLMDSGANVEVSAEELLQFALMGSVYSKRLLGVSDPRVALVNNGSEPTKGTPVYREAYGLLLGDPDINFVGNVEGRDIPMDFCDVAVCDGFVGNVILKLCEGFGKFMSKSLREMFMHDPLTKLGGALTKRGIGRLKASLDFSKYGGAPVLGIPKPVIKAHGSSDEEAVGSAVDQAVYFYENGICGEIAALASKFREERK